MVKEASFRFAWFRDGLWRIAGMVPLKWYQGRPPMFDYIEMESLAGDAAYRNWEDKVREFKFNVKKRWTRGEVDEIRRLEGIGLYHHARFMSVVEDMVGRGDIIKAQEMAASARLQARVVKMFMRSEEYKTMMGPLNYGILFSEKEKRRAVRGGHAFISEIYEYVRMEMLNEMDDRVAGEEDKKTYLLKNDHVKRSV